MSLDSIEAGYFGRFKVIHHFPMKLVGCVREALSRARFLAQTAWYNGSYTPRSAIEHVFSLDSVRPWQVPGELLELAEVVQAQRPRTILEIGSAKGGTLFVWCQMADPQATVVSIDLPGGEFGGGYTPDRLAFMRRFRQRGQELHLLRADSHRPETLCHVEQILGKNKIQFLFIDGDHSYDGVRQDFEMYSPFVAPSGIIGLHDIVESSTGTGGEVNRFWNEIKHKFRYREIVASRTHKGFGIGLLFLVKEAAGV